MHDKCLRQHQSFQIIELLIDLIHGDLVRGDQVCRRVVGALISVYEDAIRELVSDETLLTPALKVAINAYCARHVLRAAPELLIASKESAAVYKQVADVFVNVKEMSGVGEAIAEQLSQLTRKLETRRFSHLLDLMGTAVVLYMQKAAKEHEEEKTQGVLLEVEPDFWVSVRRFLVTPTAAVGNINNRNNTSKSNKRLRLESEEGFASRLTTPRGFSEEMRRAVISPVRDTRIPGMDTRRLICAQEQEVPHSTCLQRELNEVVKEQAFVETASKGRAILQLNNSIETMVEAMGSDYSKVGQNTSIGVDTIDDSMEAPQISSAPVKRRDVVVAGIDDSGASLLGGDLHVRSYFLCAETQRYEPVSVRGFFS